ncbi:MAG: hypothetical protein J6U54_12085 [Clostridiales bacterium]|nr:hypothetical protein [Clostridiales bacterium]
MLDNEAFDMIICDVLKFLEGDKLNTDMDNSMNNFIIRSRGYADLKVTNISEYDIERYIHEYEHHDEFCGALRELFGYLDTIFRYSEGRRWVTVHEIDGVFIFLRIDQYLCWIQAENSFDAVYRYHELFKKMLAS